MGMSIVGEENQKEVAIRGSVVRIRREVKLTVSKRE
jgi:hypothetical protein